MTTTDLIGYTGSLIVLTSFLMKEMKPLRWLNVIGCGIFVIYASITQQWPVLVTNAAILVINLYYLIVFYRTKPQS